MASGITQDEAQVGMARRSVSQSVTGISAALPAGILKITPTADARIVQHPGDETPAVGATDEFFLSGIVAFIMIERDGNMITTDVLCEITPYQ